GLAAGMLGGRKDLAMDVVQESWVRIVRFAAGFNGRSSFRTWAYRIVINHCRDMQRAMCSLNQSGPLAASRGAESASAVEAVESREDHERLRAAVDSMDAPKREILLLCYHKGMTH